MAKKQIHIRASDRLVQQLDALTVGGATVTEIVTVAVDRMHREEQSMSKITHVRYGFHAADLFDGWDDDTEYDERASAEKYAELVKAELEKQFPEAEVEVPYDFGAGGALPSPLQAQVNEYEGHVEVGTVQHIAGLVYQDYEWCVKTD